MRSCSNVTIKTLKFIFTTGINLWSDTVPQINTKLPDGTSTFRSSCWGMKTVKASSECVHIISSWAENEMLFRLRRLLKICCKLLLITLEWMFHVTGIVHQTLSFKDGSSVRDKERCLMQRQRRCLWKENWKANKMAAGTHAHEARAERRTHLLSVLPSCYVSVTGWSQPPNIYTDWP